jgi:hypothetical protein
VRDSRGSLLWIYCLVSGGGEARRWFLHGMFG